MLTDLQTRLGQTLETLVATDGVKGAVLVSRDGFTMLNHHADLLAAETFSAMTATLFGASEAALSELTSEPPSRIVIEAGATRLVAMGAGGEVLLVAQTSLDIVLDDALKLVEAAAKDVKAALGR